MKAEINEEGKEPARQEKNSLPPPEPVEKSTPPAKGTPPVKKKRSVFSRLLRLLLVVLIIFGLGALTAIYFLYIPLRQEVNARTTELATSGEQVSSLESRVEGLQALEAKNTELQSQLDQVSVEVGLLRAQLDIANAQVSLANNDPDGARKALAGTDKRLEAIGKLVPPEQQAEVTQMRDRLKLAINEMTTNVFAAQSDLTVLAKSLEDLEKSLATP